MFVKVLTGAVLASVLGAFGALAQSTGDIGGPRELPPPGFAGQQYVDSRGCVFLRAGMAGRVNWVPRVDRDRRPMCGYPPSTGGRAVAAAAPEAAPGPAPVVAPAPAPTPTPAPAPRRVAMAEPPESSYVPAPVRVARPAAAPQMAPAAPVVAPFVAPRVAGQGRIACTTSAPVAQRLRLTNGGTVVVCSRGDGTLEGLRAPIYPPGAGVGASLSPPEGRVVPLGQPSGIGSGSREARVAQHSAPVPKGYKPAWQDDRLNPLRGVGTAEGQAAQDQLWTRDLPAQMQGAEVRAETQVTRSTKSAPAEAAPRASSGGIFVQVGSFGVPANAAGASARLAGLGLPVAMSKGRIGGKAVQVVLAGPFGSSAEAQAALRAARGAGFGDAFLR
ncbi:MAG: SPOR domain-containing protein [Paracoccaceae bacterium]